MEEKHQAKLLRKQLNEAHESNESLIDRIDQLKAYILRAGFEVPSSNAGMNAPLVVLEGVVNPHSVKRRRTINASYEDASLREVSESAPDDTANYADSGITHPHLGGIGKTPYLPSQMHFQKDITPSDHNYTNMSLAAQNFHSRRDTPSYTGTFPAYLNGEYSASRIHSFDRPSDTHAPHLNTSEFRAKNRSRDSLEVSRTYQLDQSQLQGPTKPSESGHLSDLRVSSEFDSSKMTTNSIVEESSSLSHEKAEEALQREREREARDQEQKRQEQEREREREREEHEQERLEQERLEQQHEQERLEQQHEQEKLHNQREQERLEQERIEQQRIEQERLEKERLEKERLEKERLEQQRLEQQREQEKIREERAEKARKARESAIQDARRLGVNTRKLRDSRPDPQVSFTHNLFNNSTASDSSKLDNNQHSESMSRIGLNTALGIQDESQTNGSRPVPNEASSARNSPNSIKPALKPKLPFEYSRDSNFSIASAPADYSASTIQSSSQGNTTAPDIKPRPSTIGDRSRAGEVSLSQKSTSDQNRSINSSRQSSHSIVEDKSSSETPTRSRSRGEPLVTSTPSISRNAVDRSKVSRTGDYTSPMKSADVTESQEFYSAQSVLPGDYSSVNSLRDNMRLSGVPASEMSDLSKGSRQSTRDNSVRFSLSNEISGNTSTETITPRDATSDHSTSSLGYGRVSGLPGGWPKLPKAESPTSPAADNKPLPRRKKISRGVYDVDFEKSLPEMSQMMSGDVSELRQPPRLD